MHYGRPSLFNFAWGWKLSLCGGIWVSFHNMILEIFIFSLFALSTYLQSLRLLDPKSSGSDRYLGRFWFLYVEMWNPNSIFLCSACCCWRGGCPCLSVFSKYTQRSELLCAKTLNSIWRHGILHLFVGMKTWGRPPPQSWAYSDEVSLKLICSNLSQMDEMEYGFVGALSNHCFPLYKTFFTILGRLMLNWILL